MSALADTGGGPSPLDSLPWLDPGTVAPLIGASGLAVGIAFGVLSIFKAARAAWMESRAAARDRRERSDESDLSAENSRGVDPQPDPKPTSPSLLRLRGRYGLVVALALAAMVMAGSYTLAALVLLAAGGSMVFAGFGLRIHQHLDAGSQPRRVVIILFLLALAGGAIALPSRQWISVGMAVAALLSGAVAVAVIDVFTVNQIPMERRRAIISRLGLVLASTVVMATTATVAGVNALAVSVILLLVVALGGVIFWYLFIANRHDRSSSPCGPRQ